MDKKTNKNVLCLSWCDADDVMNYGQILQACAMMTLIRERTKGNVKYISYYPRNFKSKFIYYKRHLNFKNGHLQAYLKSKRIIKKIIEENDISFFQISHEKILRKYSRDIDIAICGSDQIWHPKNYNGGYYLSFIPSKIKKVAFAASLPKSMLEPVFTEEYTKISSDLRNFDSIYVREKSSAAFISILSQKEVKNVIDPTLMIGSEVWEELVEPFNTPEKYIFVYIPNGMTVKMATIIESLKKEYNIDDVIVMMTRGENTFEQTINLKFVSIGEFLYLIKHASLVFTSSFHAVAFSILFHVNFYCYDVPNPARGEDLRLVDMVSLFGLQSRLIEECYGGIYQDKIDYNDVDNILCELKKYAFTELQNVFTT